jgi:hypothetical protein
MIESLHIAVNHYGPHGHSSSHENPMRISIKTQYGEETRHGPVRILMRDGQWLREPELVETLPKGGAARRTTSESVRRCAFQQSAGN